MIFGKGDLSQIEFRITAWLAGQDDLVQALREGHDVYSEFATEELFHRPIRKPRKSDPLHVAKRLEFQRGFSKDGCLGFTYGMGPQRLYDDCLAVDSLRPLFESGEYDFEFIKKIIYGLRNKYSKIPEFWKTVEKAWKFATKYPKRGQWKYKNLLEFYHRDGATFITLPSGRFLRYPNATVDRKGQAKYRPDGHKKYLGLWGGTLTENIVSGCARDIFGEALLRFDNVVTHTHDDIVCLLKDENELPEMLDKMCIVPVWAAGLPIAVEGSCSKRYGGD